MTQKERLIEILSRYFQIGDSYAYNLTRDKMAFSVGTMHLDDFEEFDEVTVADIADHLLANGVVIPPCKVGDTVYSIEPCLSKVFVGEVYEIFLSKYGIVCRSTRKGYYSLAFHSDSVGKTVFFTREEAEKALKERNNEIQ